MLAITFEMRLADIGPTHATLVSSLNGYMVAIEFETRFIGIYSLYISKFIAWLYVEDRI